MYPAQALVDDVYTHDDLPDIVFTRVFDLDGNPIDIEFSKLDSPIISVFDQLAHYFQVGAGEIGSGDEGVIVNRADVDPPQWEWYTAGFAGINGLGLCLVSDLELPSELSSLVIVDDFADTYTITTPFSSGTVTRFALCNWAGIDGNGCPLQLLYGGFGSDPETEPAEGGLKWSVSFQKYEEPEGLPAGCTVSYGRLKGGFQNSPVGTYDIVYATEGSEFATVS
jgi:hypothetical protein